jgi:site-specific DNA recombinase
LDWGYDLGEQIGVTVPAIISRALYDAAQKQLRLNMERARRNTRSDYLLTGMLFCARCGIRMHGLGGTRGSPRYNCPNRARSHYIVPERKCDNTIYPAGLLEGEVWKAIQEYLTSPLHVLERKSTDQRRIAASARGARLLDDLAAVGRAIERLAREESRMLEAYRLEAIDLLALKREVASIKERRAVLEEEQAKLHRQRDEGRISAMREETLEERRRLAREGASALGYAGRRKVLSQLEISCHVDGKRVTIAGMLWHNICLVFDDVERTSHEWQPLPEEHVS